MIRMYIPGGIHFHDLIIIGPPKSLKFKKFLSKYLKTIWWPSPFNQCGAWVLSHNISLVSFALHPSMFDVCWECHWVNTINSYANRGSSYGININRIIIQCRPPVFGVIVRKAALRISEKNSRTINNKWVCHCTTQMYNVHFRVVKAPSSN